MSARQQRLIADDANDKYRSKYKSDEDKKKMLGTPNMVGGVRTFKSKKNGKSFRRHKNRHTRTRAHKNTHARKRMR